MNSPIRARRSAWIAALLAACAAPPPAAPLTPPAVDAGVRYFAGSVLSGRSADASAADRLDPTEALAVDCTVTYVDRLDATALEPIALRTRLIVSGRSGEPLLPVATLAVDARIGVGASARDYADGVERADQPQHAVPMLSLRGAVAPGVTAAFFAESMDVTLSDSGEAVRKLTAVLVGRETGADAGSTSIALLLEDITPSPTATPKSEIIASMDDVLRRQIVLLDVPTGIEDGPIVLAIPSPFAAGLGHAFVVRIAIRGPAPADQRQIDALARCAEDLRSEGAAAEAARATLDVDAANAVTLRASLRALDLAQNHRATLLFLAADRSGSPLALDLALSADDATLAAWAQLVEAEIGNGGAAPSPELAGKVAWAIERTAFELLSKRLDRDELSVPMQGMLARHAGEASRFPGTITAALARANSSVELERILLEENLGFLDAPNPSSRVRAYDWLAMRGKAPPGFDPLASRDERRAALAAPQAETPQPTTTAETGR